MHPTPVVLPGKSHGWRSLVGYSPWGLEELDTTEWLHFYFSLSCTGEGNGNPLQYSCLENPRDGEACWTAFYGVAQSQTRLTWLSNSSSCIHIILPAPTTLPCDMQEDCHYLHFIIEEDSFIKTIWKYIKWEIQLLVYKISFFFYFQSSNFIDVKKWNTGQIYFNRERRWVDPKQYFPGCVLGML